MPYIKSVDRKKLLKGKELPSTAGELNFIITCFCKAYLLEKGLSYQNINDVVGALEGAKLEFYRRVAAPYEDIKIEENGDVYFK
jgi:hypothetical protein